MLTLLFSLGTIPVALFTFVESYFIFGKMKIIRARRLSNQERLDLKLHGVVHLTTEEAAKSILREGIIRRSKWYLSYSNGFKSCAFFFNAKLLDVARMRFNVGKNKNTKISITNLSDEQIESMRTRLYDNSILCPRNFKIEPWNNVTIDHVAEGQQNVSKRELHSCYNKLLFRISAVTLILNYGTYFAFGIYMLY